jgi:hypothetical protein
MGHVSSTGVRLRTGVVSAYVGAGDIESVRRIRRVTGRVTLSSKTGLRVLASLAQAGDLDGVDLDPAGYMKRDNPQLALIAEDWTSRQRDLGLSVIRSQGRFVPQSDTGALKTAMSEVLADDVVRVISVDSKWLQRPDLEVLLNAVRVCDNALAFVLASQMDPLSTAGTVEGLRELLDTARDGGRRVELLRTDLTGIAFAALGGTLGAVGLSTSGRHHSLPLQRRHVPAFRARQRWPLVLVPQLASWQRGSSLGALSPFAGAGLTDCSCTPCAGRSLLRFDHEWQDQVPVDVQSDAQSHDLAEWSRLAWRVLAADRPAREWARACAEAVKTAESIALRYKVAFKVPKSLTSWARLAG